MTVRKIQNIKTDIIYKNNKDDAHVKSKGQQEVSVRGKIPITAISGNIP
ncbi:MAG: hypothetical protein Q8942_11215 [Bacillota bacterium]|nr:hypothetical protein [Bacillota bacterium]